MHARLPLCLALLAATGACGRTGFDLPPGEEDGLGEDGAAVADDGDNGRGDDSDPPEPELPSPVDMEGCGNGIIEEGELCYLDMVVYPSRIDPCGIDVGDLDGDGHVDVAVPNSDFDHDEASDNFVSVLYGDGRGHLSDPFPFLAGGDFAVGIKIADFDNDAIDDLAVTNSASETATILIGRGGRDYAEGSGLRMGPEPTIADAGDLNGDGNLDLAVTTGGSNAVMVALGRGDGTFQTAIQYVRAMNPWDVEFVDLNGDAALDLAVTDIGYSDIEVFYGDGTGALKTGDPLRAGDYPSGLTIADLKGNGLQDLIVAHDTGVTLLVARGDGTFWRSPVLPAGSEPREVAVADFDNNGSLDLAVLASSGEDITFLVETDWFDFVFADLKRVGTLPSGIRSADFNADGVPDLAVSNQLDNTVGLILSNP